jgi:hypothetical protein
VFSRFSAPGGDSGSRLSFVTGADDGCASTELGEEPGSERVSLTSFCFTDSTISGVSRCGLVTISSADDDSWIASA